MGCKTIAEVLVGQAIADVPERGLPVDLGGDHQLDELLGAHLFPAPAGFHLRESLLNLRKNRKELFKCGLIGGILVHVDVPYVRDYGQGLPCYISIIRDFYLYIKVYSSLSLLFFRFLRLSTPFFA